ncbi:MAG TPA: hypothetical protein DIS79_06360 [Bacteroidetes bacterium]|nr:hypothetical protein [Bacteroidota bacterium]HRK04087.1 hypothetical protein [Chlorobiota bacterium]
MIPKWFTDLANVIDWPAIDNETQAAFRAKMIDLVNSYIPTIKDGPVTKAKKIGILKAMAIKAKLK